jgi:hypothetical protein
VDSLRCRFCRFQEEAILFLTPTLHGPVIEPIQGIGPTFISHARMPYHGCQSMRSLHTQNANNVHFLIAPYAPGNLAIPIDKYTNISKYCTNLGTM